MMDLIETGKIVNTHGVRGDVKLVLWTDDPYSVAQSASLYIGGTEYPVEKARFHKNALLVKLKGIDCIEDAQKLKNKVVFVESSLFSLDAGEYFFRDLLGMSVEDADTGFCYGKITDIFHTGANDVYEVTAQNGKKYLVPAIRDCIHAVDTENKRMAIHPMEGLFDL